MPYSVIACITGHPDDDDVLFAARQKAMMLGSTWCALYLPSQNKEAENHQYSLSYTKIRALGGDILYPDESELREGIANYIRKIGQEQGQGIHVYLADALRSWRGGIRIALLEQGKSFFTLHRIRVTPHKLNFWRLRQRFGGETVREIVKTLGYVVAATLVLKILFWLNPESLFLSNNSNISILYLIICMVAAILHGLLPGLIACLLSLLTINFYFANPFHGFYFSSLEEAFHAVLFLTAGTVIALVGSGTRLNVLMTRERERQLHTLLSLSRTLSLPLSQPEALAHLLAELRELLHRDIIYYLPDTLNSSQVASQHPEGTVLDPVAQAALTVCWKDYVPTGSGTAHVEDSKWRFQPMLSNRGFNGAIGVHMALNETTSDDAFDQLLEGVADLSATILDRIDRTSLAEQTRVHEERDRMHTMMMSSVSHDLKTPLASVIGSLNAYRSMYDTLSEEHRKTLTDTALEEAVRLDHFITNILDLAKLENSSVTTFPLEMSDPLELVQLTVKRLGPRLAHHRIRIACPRPLEAMLNATLTRQIIYHLLDNAAKYSPLDSMIHIGIEYVDDTRALEIHIRDEGDGVEPSMQMSIFNKYTRLKNTDRQIAGTGLGLAVSRLAAEMQGGTLEMHNHPDGGAVFTFRLPECHLRA